MKMVLSSLVLCRAHRMFRLVRIIHQIVWGPLQHYVPADLISKVQSNEESLREHPAKDERLDSMLQKGTLFCGLLS